MDRVMAVTNDGRLFYFEPPNESMVSIENRSLKSSSKPVSRISVSDWCLWAINYDSELYLYVHARRQPIQVLESVLEDQKRYSSSMHEEYSSYLLKLHEDDHDGSKSSTVTFEATELPSESWEWQGNWYYDNSNTDSQVWTFLLSIRCNTAIQAR